MISNMFPYLVPVAPFLMVVCIMIVVFSFAAFKHWLRFQAERERNSGGNRVPEILSRLDRIEQRVANLETIVLEAEKTKGFREL